MGSDTFKPRSKEFWAMRALKRRETIGYPGITTGPASDVRRIDPATGDVIEFIRSEEEASQRKPGGRKGRNRVID